MDQLGIQSITVGFLLDIRLLGATEASDSMRAQALRHAGNLVDVYSNSWGPPDYGFGEVSNPGTLTKQAIKEGILKVSRFLSLTFECDFKINRIRCVYDVLLAIIIQVRNNNMYTKQG